MPSDETATVEGAPHNELGRRVQRVVIQNYRCLRSADVRLKPGMNVIVGNNEAGKSTFLEAVHLALTCQLNGRSIRNQLHPHLFNEEVVTEYCTAVAAGKRPTPPEIRIEVHFADAECLTRYRGMNNLERRDGPGVRLTIRLDDELGDEYSAHLERGEVPTVPVEYYVVEWTSFADDPIHHRRAPVKSRLIDTTAVVAQRGTSRYLLDVVDDYLDGTQRSELALAYRLLKSEFAQHEAVKLLNEGLSARAAELTDKSLTVSLDTTATGSWQNAVVPVLDEVPFALIGRGEQASLKLRLAVDAASSASVVLVEEPENHQSHSRLSSLLEALRAAHAGKQFVVTTHSSFVVNKLGVADVLLFNRGQSLRLSDLDEDTRKYFMKLPGYDTLRLILAKRAILVEGPSDELIVQRAFWEEHGSWPLAAGVDVISVGALAFRRFEAIAGVLETPVTILTDNDGDPAGVRARYATDAPNIRLCVSDDASLPSLEQQVVACNDLETLNDVLGSTHASKQAAEKWMVANKTEAALRIFDAEAPISYPGYIRDAVTE